MREPRIYIPYLLPGFGQSLEQLEDDSLLIDRRDGMGWVMTDRM